MKNKIIQTTNLGKTIAVDNVNIVACEFDTKKELLNVNFVREWLTVEHFSNYAIDNSKCARGNAVSKCVTLLAVFNDCSGKVWVKEIGILNDDVDIDLSIMTGGITLPIYVMGQIEKLGYDAHRKYQLLVVSCEEEYSKSVLFKYLIENISEEYCKNNNIDFVTATKLFVDGWNRAFNEYLVLKNPELYEAWLNIVFARPGVEITITAVVRDTTRSNELIESMNSNNRKNPILVAGCEVTSISHTKYATQGLQTGLLDITNAVINLAKHNDLFDEVKDLIKSNE